MNETKEKPYNLVHMTSSEIAQKILSNGFIGSKHDLNNLKNQWLGDGVYFWDGNDDEIIPFSKKMLSNKFKKSEMTTIYVNLVVNTQNHINLELDKWMESFKRFLLKTNPQKAEQVLDMMRILREKVLPDPKRLSEIGKFLGSNINDYVNELNDRGFQVDMVSCYFFHGKNKINLFGKSEKIRKQYCIKNIDMLNSNIDNFKIY